MCIVVVVVAMIVGEIGFRCGHDGGCGCDCDCGGHRRDDSVIVINLAAAMHREELVDDGTFTHAIWIEADQQAHFAMGGKTLHNLSTHLSPFSFETLQPIVSIRVMMEMMR